MDARLDRTAVQAHVEFACLRSPGIEFLLLRLLTWALAQRPRCQAVFGQHEQLPAFVTADVLRHDLAFVQQVQLITVGANGDGAAHELWRRTNCGGVE
jgi:hypothetical protein